MTLMGQIAAVQATLGCTAENYLFGTFGGLAFAVLYGPDFLGKVLPATPDSCCREIPSILKAVVPFWDPLPDFAGLAMPALPPLRLPLHRCRNRKYWFLKG